LAVLCFSRLFGPGAKTKKKRGASLVFFEGGRGHTEARKRPYRLNNIKKR